MKVLALLIFGLFFYPVEAETLEMEQYQMVLTIKFPDHIEQEKRPVQVPLCQTIEGVRTEDSSCGIKACMKLGRQRAAVIWGQAPELNLGFDLICLKPGEGEEASSAPRAPGHGSMHWEEQQ